MPSLFLESAWRVDGAKRNGNVGGAGGTGVSHFYYLDRKRYNLKHPL